MIFKGKAEKTQKSITHHEAVKTPPKRKASGSNPLGRTKNAVILVNRGVFLLKRWTLLCAQRSGMTEVMPLSKITGIQSSSFTITTVSVSGQGDCSRRKASTSKSGSCRRPSVSSISMVCRAVLTTATLPES